MLKRIGFIIVTAFFFGCGKIVGPQDTDGFGLTKIEFTISSEYLGILNSMVYARREVPAQIEIAGETRKIFVRYSGQATLGSLKKSYTIEFAEGDRASTADEEEPGLFRGHRQYVISAQNGDSTKLHSALGFYAFQQAGFLTSEAEPAAVYLNGEYQGLYYLIEPIDADFFRLRHQRLGSLYEAFIGIAHDQGAHFTFVGGYDVRLGFASRGEQENFYGDLEHLIRTLDAATPENLPERIEPLLDVENYLRYLAVSVLLHNWDGYFNNFRLHLEPQIGKFQFIPWDLDNILEFNPEHDRLEGANELSAKLLEVRAYRQRYKQILLELMDDKLTVASLEARLEETALKIAEAFAHDRFLTAPGNKPLGEHLAGAKLFIRKRYDRIRRELAGWE
jgi:spore coat protein H